ncbi:uncharacterized protein [Primulina eburnea]|uniref:uncharacterized protein n=1 Tax=Primulina eburnea TaxID=1245227 RepID=UPI003C6C7902
MDTFLSFKPVLIPPSPNLHSNHLIFSPNYCQKVNKFRGCAKSKTNQDSESENVLLKIAWYGSEFLGIAASFLRSPTRTEDAGGGVTELSIDGLGKIDRAVVVAVIKEDVQRSYFVTGKLTLDAYEENCEFADPASSF